MTQNSPAPLDAAEHFAWRAFIETVFDLTRALAEDLSATELTLGDYQVLVFLSEAETRSMRMCDLAGRLQLSPSGLTRRLDGLVRHGYVDRRPSEADRRVMLAALTEKGQTKLADAYPYHLASVRRHIIDRLDPAGHESLGRIFSTIRDGLDKSDEPGLTGSGAVAT